MKAQVRYHRPGFDPTINTRPPRSLLPYFLRQLVLLAIFLVVLACGGTFLVAYKAGQDTARNALVTLTAAVDQTQTATLATIEPSATPSETPTGTLTPTETPTITLTPSETPTGTLTPTTTPNLVSVQATATMLAHQVRTVQPTATASPTATATPVVQPRFSATRTHIEVVHDVEVQRVVVTSRPIIKVEVQEVTRVHVNTVVVTATYTAPTATLANVGTATATTTPTLTETATATPTLTPTATETATATDAPTTAPTLTPTETPTDVPIEEVNPTSDSDQTEG